MVSKTRLSKVGNNIPIFQVLCASLITQFILRCSVLWLAGNWIIFMVVEMLLQLNLQMAASLTINLMLNRISQMCKMFDTGCSKLARLIRSVSGDGAEAPRGSGLWLRTERRESCGPCLPSPHHPLSHSAKCFLTVALLKAHFQQQATKDNESPVGDFGPKCNMFERNRQNRESFFLVSRFIQI